jgi:hypothetical protein
MATPIFTTTPALTATYNPGMADTFSWIPMEGAGRPLFARAVYVVGGGGAGAGGANGFDFVVPSSIYTGPYSSVQVVSACRITGLTATGVSTTTVQNLTAYTLPADFAFTANIQGIRLQFGTVIAYK